MSVKKAQGGYFTPVDRKVKGTSKRYQWSQLEDKRQEKRLLKDMMNHVNTKGGITTLESE